MRRIGQLLLGAVIAVLFLAAGSALVVGPERAAADNTAAAQTMPMYLRAEGVPVDDVVPLPLMQQEERAEAPHTDQEHCEVPRIVVADGNGWPVTGRTWTRTVYAVCPPEGMPG